MNKVIVVLIACTIGASTYFHEAAGAVMVVALASLIGYVEWLAHSEKLHLDKAAEFRIDKTVRDADQNIREYVLQMFKAACSETAIVAKSLDSQTLELTKKFDNLNATVERQKNDLAAVKNATQKH